MIIKCATKILFLFLLSFAAYAACEDNETVDKTSEYKASQDKEIVEKVAGDIEAGEVRYNKTCKNCHGPAGKGVASYPKISGQEVSYTKKKLETYREGIKIGPNSSLMIMMARKLTDEEITNLAAYLKDATYE